MSTEAWLALAGTGLLLLLVDLRIFAPGREAGFREGVVWSVGWLVLSIGAAGILWSLEDSDAGVTYLTVYFIERALSLDNLFVFLLLFAYFKIPAAQRARLLFWGIVAALVLRGLAILGGVALLEQFSWVTYVLGATLVYLGFRVSRGIDEDVDPERGLAVRAVRAVVPAATPFALCLAAIVASDLAFAIDSIPAAFAITRDSFLIWMGNVFALLGLRSLFVLVRGLVRRFRYLDQTIGAVLALVGVKLLLQDTVHIGPAASLGAVLGFLTIGAVISLIADRRDPEGADDRRAKEDF